MESNQYKILTQYTPRIRFSYQYMGLKKVLVIAPHPDDETIGCGGTILNMLNENIDVKVVLLTESEKDDKDVRLGEFKNAMKILGCSAIYDNLFQDGQLSNDIDALVEYISKIICLEKPELIFVPYIFDAHGDHVAIHKILTQLMHLEETFQIAMYEVWTPILYPNYYLDITKVMAKKKEALHSYSTQETKYGIIKKSEALNGLRGILSSKKDFSYVEAFKILNKEQYLKCAANI